MTAMIACPREVLQRIFPTIGICLYTQSTSLRENATADQLVAQKLLALANQGLTFSQRFLGWKLDAQGRIGRLLLKHKVAMEAELASQWQRADFFWKEICAELKILSGQADLWQKVAETVAKGAGTVAMHDPQQLRQRLVEEIFIDTHCAFYNGRIKRTEKFSEGDRALIHLHYINKLLPLSALSKREQTELLDPADEMRINAYKEAKKWDEAIEVCAGMLKRSPNRVDYQDKLAELSFAKTLSRLRNGSSDSQSLEDAETLLDGINRLEQIRKDNPHNALVFELLGSLYNVRAIKLANGNRLSQSLVDAQKALIFNPYLEEAKETFKKLAELMEKLQAQMKALRAQLASRPGAYLNAEGLRMQEETQKGFGPLNSYLESAEATDTAQAFSVAQARNVWYTIGLAPPIEIDQWNERALALLKGLGVVINNPPAKKSGVPPAWHEIAQVIPELAGLPASPICAFLERRIFTNQEDNKPPTAKTYEPSVEPPILTVDSKRNRRDSEPFTYWLFSRQDIRVKLQGAVAIVLLLLAGGLTLKDYWHRHARDRAYRQVTVAVENQDDLRIIEGAETYFANRPLSGKDGRDTQVVDIYNEAFVRWFAGQEGEPKSDALTHIERYRTLMINANLGAN